ncbi:MAG: ribosome biogenesis GTPase YlqF [Firmicutes bacterium]|nr:ribosome biogenesis GTPase YlqF [Bacillota bacterium]
MTIQWYPGHMTRAKRIIREDLKIVDGVIEVIDARVPLSSRNPNFRDLTSKPRILALAKIDLADAGLTAEWLNYWRDRGERALGLDLLADRGLRDIVSTVQELFPTLNRNPRLLVMGIPNVGKSTLINRLTKRRGARVGARPGVTRGKQWLAASGMQLLDSPGILWPKFEDQEVARKLALVASIRDEVFDQVEIAWWLLNYLAENYLGNLKERYGKLDKAYPLEDIGQKRGCLLPGGVVDLNQAAAVVLKDFRTGKLGPITLDGKPPKAEV